MGIELKINFKNKFLLWTLLINIFFVLTGFGLVVALDKVPIANLTFGELVGSTYTVYTQIGNFVLVPILISQFCKDYKDKNMIFYKSLNHNFLTYYLTKLTVSCLISIIGVLLATLMICVPYGQFGINFVIVFLKFSAVVIFYNITTFILVFIIPNPLIVFALRFLLWLFTTFIALEAPIFRFFSYYDSSFLDNQKFVAFMGYMYNSFENFSGDITTKDMFIFIGQNYLYNIFLIILSLLLIYVFRKKWLINGCK